MKKLLILFLLIGCVCGAQTRPHWLDIAGAPLIDIRQYGAVDGGVVNCNAAIVAANSAAVASGGTILIPNGNYYIGSTTITISKNLISMGTLTGDDCILAIASGVRVRGGTYTGVRFQTYQKTNILIEDATISGVTKWGIGLYETTYSTVRDCNISGITYEATLLAADGIYMGTCTHVDIIGNTISNFRRIGITADINSDYIRITGNNVSNANNCDDSATEWNGGIWAESVNNVTVADNDISDITGNAGQTSGRVRGMTVAGNHTATGTQSITNNVIDGLLNVGNSAALPSYANVIVSGNTFTNTTAAEQAISCIGAMQSLTIEKNAFNGFAGTNIQFSTIMVGTNIATLTQDLVVINDNVFNTTHTGGAADVFIFASYPPKKMVISNCKKVQYGAAFKTAATGTFLIVENSTISGPASPYAMTNFSDMRFNKCVMGGIAVESSANGITSISNSSLSSITATSRASSTFELLNCNISGSILSAMATDSTLIVDGCIISGFGAGGGSGGGILTNFENTTRTRVFVRGTTFLKPAASSGLAIIKNGYAPTNVFTHGNYYNYPVASFTDLVGTHTANVAF